MRTSLIQGIAAVRILRLTTVESHSIPAHGIY